MVRRYLAVVALTLMLAIGFGSRVARAGEQDFTLHNSTGVEIHAVYVAPSASESWEENLIEGQTLPNGSSLNVHFSPKEDAAEWDIRVDDGSGNYLYWRGLNLKEISEVELDGDGVAHVK